MDTDIFLDRAIHRIHLPFTRPGHHHFRRERNRQRQTYIRRGGSEEESRRRGKAKRYVLPRPSHGGCHAYHGRLHGMLRMNLWGLSNLEASANLTNRCSSHGWPAPASTSFGSQLQRSACESPQPTRCRNSRMASSSMYKSKISLQI